MPNRLSHLVSPLLGLVVGLGLGLLLTMCAGENPWTILTLLFKSAFGSRYDLGLTLFYATPLIFCGLSVAVAFHSGLFNIGAEGQLTLGALTAALVGFLLPNLPPLVAPLLAVLAAAGVGGFWAWIAGWLRTRRGSHEVINTIMLNFIASALASWFISAHFQNPHSQNPETPDMGINFFIRPNDPVARFFGDAPVSIGILFAILAALALWHLLYRSVLGYEIRAVGQNEEAARVAGIDVARTRQIAMALAGALAACVCIGEVLGSAGRFRLGFSADFGFIGIAVALMAQNRPIAIIFAGLLFGAIHKGAADLDIETENVTRDLAVIIQALIILSVAVFSYLPTWFERRARSKVAP